MISQRFLDYTDHAKAGARFDLESVSHMVTGRTLRPMFRPNQPVGSAFVHVNRNALPRARLLGRPVYVEDQASAVQALERLGAESRTRLIVEDPDRPLGDADLVSGTARIVEELPERVAIETDCSTPSYLFLADTFDPGWSATVDGRPAPIRPAYVAFRAVYLPAGPHRVVFVYRPAGFLEGLIVSLAGAAIALVMLVLPGSGPRIGGDDHLRLHHARRLRALTLAIIVAIVVASTVRVDAGRKWSMQPRWKDTFHRFTWGAGIEAMNRQ